MFAVVFEVRPRADRFDGYLDIARMLRPEIEKIDGFLENTRYRSRSRPDTLLSLSLWRDEKAVIRWRTHAAHYAGQARGRREILEDYRLRVGEIAAMHDGAAAHALTEHRFDATEVGDAKAMVFHLTRAGAPAPTLAGAIETDGFDGIVDAADTAAMTTWASEAAAQDALGRLPIDGRRLVVRVIRDYGLLDRREAPQFHEAVARLPARDLSDGLGPA